MVASTLLAACGGGEAASDPTGDDDTATSEVADENPEGEAAEFESRTLTVQTMNLENSAYGEMIRSLTEAVSDETDGAVQFDIHYADGLCPAAEIAECVGDGRVDIGWTTAIYTPGQFPITELYALAFQTSDLPAAVTALLSLYEESEEFQAEYETNNQHLLHMGPGGLLTLGTSGVDLNSMNDLEGIQVRLAGDIARAMEDLGIDPVALAPGETYEGLQRGVIDGAAGPFDFFPDYRLHEVTDAYYDFAPLVGYYAMHHTAINLDVWNSLEPELQEVLQSVGREISTTTQFEIYETYRDDMCALLAEEGEVRALPDEMIDELEPWAERWSDTFRTEWVNKATEAGVEDAESLLNRYDELLQDEEAKGGSYETDGEHCMNMAG